MNDQSILKGRLCDAIYNQYFEIIEWLIFNNLDLIPKLNLFSTDSFNIIINHNFMNILLLKNKIDSLNYIGLVWIHF